MFSLGITYSTITPESCSQGDFADTGWAKKTQLMSLRDVMNEIDHHSTIYMESYGNNITLNGESYIVNYRSGEEEINDIHITASTRRIKRLTKLIKQWKGLK